MFRAALQTANGQKLENVRTMIANNCPITLSWEAEAIEDVAVLLRVASSTIPENLAPTMK